MRPGLAAGRRRASLLAASPTPLRRRVAVPVAVAAAVAGATWLVLVTGSALRVDGVPVLGLTVQALALSALGLAVAAVLRTWRGHSEPGVLAAPVVVALVLAALPLPPRWSLLVPVPDAPGWDASVLRWTALLVVAVVVLLAATRDPAAR